MVVYNIRVNHQEVGMVLTYLLLACSYWLVRYAPDNHLIRRSAQPGLSIDYAANKLYWISSGNSTINRCNLDGSGLEVLEPVKKQLLKGTALAIMGEWPFTWFLMSAID